MWIKKKKREEKWQKSEKIWKIQFNHPLRKHYEYFSCVKSWFKSSIKGGSRRISPHRSGRKCGRSSMDDDRTTRIAGITWARVAFIKPRHVSSRIRGWCSWLERGVARDEAFNTSNLFLRSVYNGVRAKRFFLLNWIIEQVYFSSNKFEKSNYKFIYLVSSIISRVLLENEDSSNESLSRSLLLSILRSNDDSS